MTKETKSNSKYTADMEARILECGPVINNEVATQLADEFGFGVRSVRAKIVTLDGVEYQKQAKKTKTGEPVESKADIVAEISELLGGGANESLEMANKEPLKRVRSALQTAAA